MCVYFATDIDRINNEYMPRLDLEIGRYWHNFIMR